MLSATVLGKLGKDACRLHALIIVTILLRTLCIFVAIFNIFSYAFSSLYLKVLQFRKVIKKLISLISFSQKAKAKKL